VCHVLGYRPSPGGGGTEKHVYELAQGLTARGVSVDVMCEDRAYLPDRLHDLPVRFITVASGSLANDGWLERSREKSQRFAQALDPTHYDIVHAHNHYGVDIALKLAGLEQRPALVTTFHLTAGGLLERFRQLGLGEPDNPSVERAVAGMESTVARLSDCSIAVSRGVAYELQALYGQPANRVTSVPNWFDPQTFTPHDLHASRRLLDLDPDGRYLLYVGEFRWDRGRFLAEVLRRLPSWVTLLAIHPAEDAQIRAEFGDRVRFVGYVPHDRMALYYSAADLQCFPAVYAGFGLVLAEGMACGCPPVVFDFPAMNEVVTKESGYLVGGYSAEAYAATLIRALDERRVTREAARRRARSFEMRSQIDTVLSLYQRAAAQARERKHDLVR
jgi:glycosyltransferase involved in cell wall biosynthesis